jgi:pyocin large subunit-like protein
MIITVISMVRLSRKIITSFLLVSCFYISASQFSTVNATTENQQNNLLAYDFLVAANWVATDFAPGKLDVHFNKHGAEWGAGNITKEAYRKRAISILNSPIGGDIMGFTDKEGYRFRYNKKTNEFATGKPDGTVETLFRPSNGLSYYEDQVKKYGQ